MCETCVLKRNRSFFLFFSLSIRQIDRQTNSNRLKHVSAANSDDKSFISRECVCTTTSSFYIKCYLSFRRCYRYIFATSDVKSWSDSTVLLVVWDNNILICIYIYTCTCLMCTCNLFNHPAWDDDKHSFMSQYLDCKHIFIWEPVWLVTAKQPIKLDFLFRFINGRRRIVQPLIDQSNRVGGPSPPAAAGAAGGGKFWVPDL